MLVRPLSQLDEYYPMTEIPVKQLSVGIGGVALVAMAAGVVYRWAIRSDPGGPFSVLLPMVGTTGAAALILLGGGLLVAVSWLFDLFFDNRM